VCACVCLLLADVCVCVCLPCMSAMFTCSLRAPCGIIAPDVAMCCSTGAHATARERERECVCVFVRVQSVVLLQSCAFLTRSRVYLFVCTGSASCLRLCPCVPTPDVRTLLPDEKLINDTAPATFREYNTDQMLRVPNGDHQVCYFPFLTW
jgi:hypothetical protein